MGDRTSDASALSERRRDFRERIIARDGTCVITGDLADNCTACHILPHSKGDDVRLYDFFQSFNSEFFTPQLSIY